MKYMGSKRWQLGNGLGEQLRRVVSPGETFVDLFSGSGAVSWFAATELKAAVTAVDLQQYAVALSAAVIERTKPVDAARLVREWLEPVHQLLVEPPAAVAQERRDLRRPLTATTVKRLRSAASTSDDTFVRSYAGHYYSTEQAYALGRLRASLPARKPAASVCLAALVTAASRCSASPGHTAQPFQPTEKALPHIDTIWHRDLVAETESALRSLATTHAAVRGEALVGDANEIAKGLTGEEVVFVDPPYSAAQYSRFYHVLEAVAVGGYDQVSGAGRSPGLAERRSSDYSCVSSARTTLTSLLEQLGGTGCRVIATFPQFRASNGLSGADIVEAAREWFDVDTLLSSATFSTLGGNGAARSARHNSHELVITMYPR